MKRLHLVLIVVCISVVFLPPLAGIIMLALQVLGDPSYDLARLSLADYPRAVFALLLSGSLVGYLYGLVPALLTSLGLAWVILSGRQLNFGWIAFAILGGGVLGFAVMSLLVGGITSLTLTVTTLLGASLLWFSLKRFTRNGDGLGPTT
ncbi:MAG: hypothetical protein AB8B88_01065 [Devosiaceae bacterium]